MSDKFNPYESDHGPSEKPEFSVMIPVSEIVDALRKEKEEHSEDYLKKCPHCLNPVVFYKDNWYFCQQHSFVQIGRPAGDSAGVISIDNLIIANDSTTDIYSLRAQDGL